MKKILKICGIRDNLSNYDGIDLLGFNFIEISKRKITVKKAKEIKTPEFVKRIGLFGNFNLSKKFWQDLDRNEVKKIIKIAKETNMQGIQIYGKVDFCILKKEGFFTIKPIYYLDVEKKKLETKNIDLFIIDSTIPGSGKSYDYGKLATLKIDIPFLVAGGVNEKNIGKILKKVPNCAGVDIASGVDNGKNIDEKKIKENLKKLLYFT